MSTSSVDCVATFTDPIERGQCEDTSHGLFLCDVRYGRLRALTSFLRSHRAAKSCRTTARDLFAAIGLSDEHGNAAPSGWDERPSIGRNKLRRRPRRAAPTRTRTHGVS